MKDAIEYSSIIDSIHLINFSDKEKSEASSKAENEFALMKVRHGNN